MAEDLDPEVELAREVASQKRRAYLVVVAALVALPLLAWGVITLWQRGFRLGVVGGLVIAVVLTHRTMRKAMERRNSPPPDA